ncbi:uncharacterized protein LOC126323274 [Schistocerca gregaria]|uniref:uncharacterized protein LOC126323274 n=1 Tax=Schistocerca gregaria TaxID=7010 RepID=UPI00211E6387|nr:uncharacterized protein LOC126323274 [Schistocerca gregaria]
MPNEATSESVQICNDEGIIQPPLDIKNNIDKIASYVARNVGGEARVLADLGNNPSFGFLHVGNPYFAYYMQKVRCERNALESQKSAESATKVTAKVSEESKAVEAPPKREWIFESDITKIPPLDLEIIKLVSQFVARNGQSCQMGLWNRESKNPQFDFLQPLHPYNQLFQHLVECYTRVIYPAEGLAEYHEKCASSKQEIINRIMRRRDWNRSQIKTEEQLRAEEEAERSAMASIDWNDAVIVDTITFDPSEDMQLPQPVDKSEIATICNMAKVREEEAAKQLLIQKQGIEKAVVDAINASMQSTTAAASEASAAAGRSFSPDQKFPADYRRGARKLVMMCPICVQAIPADELEEHMKIELSRAGAGLVDKPNKNSTFPERTAMVAEGDEIASHLAKMAKRRKDIFGDEEDVMLEPAEATATLSSTAVDKDMDNMISDPNYANFNRNAPFSHNGKRPLNPGPTGSPGFPSPVAYSPHQSPQPGIYVNKPSGEYSAAQPYPAQANYVAPSHLNVFPSGYHNYPMLDVSGQYPPSLMHASAESVSQNRPNGLDEAALSAKRPKANKYIELVPEKEWLERYPGAVKVRIVAADSEILPDNKSQVELDLELSSTVKDVKEKLVNSYAVSAPVNKQALRIEELGFLKDKLSLAHYNFKPGNELILSTKERGGRKK